MTADLDSNGPWLDNVPPEELRRIVDALYRVNRFIGAVTDLEALLERIMEEGKHVANAEACSLMLYDAASEELYFEVALGESGDQQKLKREVRLKLNEGIAGAAAAERVSINVADVQRDQRFYREADEKTQFETRALLAVPLVEKDELIGVLEVVNKTGGGAFTETDRHVLEIFSGRVASVIANARLIKANLRAARMAAVGQAVAGLSHYTKNLITGMTGSVDLIDQGLNRGNTELLLQSWPIFRRNMKRIAHFVEDMLAFSRPRKPVREPTDVAELVKDVTETFWDLLSRRDAEFEVDVSGVTRPAWLDERGIFRCLLNLLRNAAEAAPREGGRIRLTARTTASGGLEIEISDNGPGIPDDHLQRIFEPFFSTKGSQGTGLGLAVTYKIVKEHGGTLTAARGPEGGALFTVSLPPADTEHAETDGEEEAE